MIVQMQQGPRRCLPTIQTVMRLGRGNEEAERASGEAGSSKQIQLIMPLNLREAFEGAEPLQLTCLEGAWLSCAGA